MNFLTRYAHWLHLRWPAGTVEPLPEITGPDGQTVIPGLRIAGDLAGVPLLKFAADTGARAVGAFVKEGFAGGEQGPGDTLDLAILGGGVAGISAALEAKRSGLRFAVFEAAKPFATIVDFPARKPIYTYPPDMVPAGELHLTADVKEALQEELETQRKGADINPVEARAERVRREGDGFLVEFAGDQKPVKARRVLVTIGRSGEYRRLGAPGEDLEKVYHRLHDPKEHAGQNALVVGGGDSALETAIALVGAGAKVTLAHRGKDFGRAKGENVSGVQGLAKTGGLTLAMETTVERVEPNSVHLRNGTGSEVPNDVVFAMIGRKAPLDFFRRSGLPVRNEWTAARVAACLAFVLFCVGLYHWKSGHAEALSFGGKSLKQVAEQRHWFPLNLPGVLERSGGALAEMSKREGNLVYTIKRGLGNTSFYYTLAYCACVVGFGVARIRRRRTQYVKWQTLTLMAVQCLPLFILPEILLPWAGRNGWFEEHSPLRWLADNLWEPYDGALGHDRAYWRSYGFILAWPLNVYNVFTDHPLWLWLGISFVQTFVIIPLIIFRWGKGAYCGWICSCGALAETLGDTHRQKMPHGPVWNRVNFVGQFALAFAFVLLGLRILGWTLGGESWAATWHHKLFEGIPYINYAWSVDILLGGILGVGLYFWFSGRVWCRFACPLAALMHVYTRFSRFRIFPDKKKCISCNVCTSVCHQGIDVMSFANKGEPMADPQCVRCSACVQSCPTNVLSFGRFDGGGRVTLDKLAAAIPMSAPAVATEPEAAR